MLVTMYYKDGVEVFDTAERVDPALYRGNTLTNWSVKLEDARGGDSLGGKRLWLDLYTHEQPSCDNAEGAHEAPVALRRSAASFLLADETDVSRLLKVSVNGEAALIRLGDELVNATRFAHIAAIADVYAPRAALTRQFLEAAVGDEIPGDPDESLCEEMGFSRNGYKALERMYRRACGSA